MISVSPEYSQRLKAMINELRGVVQNELLPLLNRLEIQCDALIIEESLITELIVLMNIHAESHTTESPSKKHEDEAEPDSQSLYDDLIAVLTELRIQGAQINGQRIRR